MARLLDQAELRRRVDEALRDVEDCHDMVPAGGGFILEMTRSPRKTSLALLAEPAGFASPVVIEYAERVNQAMQDVDSKQVADRYIQWLRQTVTRLGEHRAPWDTYSDAVHDVGPARVGAFITDEQDVVDEIDAAVKSALESLDREPQ